MSQKNRENTQTKAEIIILSASHDVAVMDKKNMALPSFQISKEQPLEIDIKDFLIKKMKANLVCMLGVHQSSAGQDVPVVLIDDPEYQLPKNMFWMPTDKYVSSAKEPDLFLEAYSTSVLKGHKMTGSFSVWPMGENELDASVLGLMAANGKKSASTSLLLEYTKGDVILPKVDNESVIVDWSGRVLCVIRTTEVKIVPFNQVDESHAAKELLGDGSLEYWQDVYWDLFDQVCKGFGDEADEEMDVVCESFEVLKKFI